MNPTLGNFFHSGLLQDSGVKLHDQLKMYVW